MRSELVELFTHDLLISLTMKHTVQLKNPSTASPAYKTKRHQAGKTAGLRELLCAANKRRRTLVIKTTPHALHKCHSEHEFLHSPSEQS